jgi:acyl dehydratase
MPEFSELRGRSLPTLHTSAERGQLRFFASVLGLTDPVHSDIDAAKAAGYPDLLIPPTFYFSLELQRPNPHAVIHEFGFDTRQFLHGEQSFDYHALAFAGEELTFTTEYTDAYEKKGGALKFIERTTYVTRQKTPIVDIRNVLVIREVEMAS